MRVCCVCIQLLTVSLPRCVTLPRADHKVRDVVRPAAVWQEIISYIKGSSEAMETEKVRPTQVRVGLNSPSGCLGGTGRGGCYGGASCCREPVICLCSGCAPLQGFLSQAQYANEVGVKRAPNFSQQQRHDLVYPIFAAYQRAKVEGRR